jgi:circadian clock protein KaiB
MTKRRKTGDATGLGMSAKAFGRAVAEHPQGRFVLTLYISGMTPRSRKAIDNIQRLCEEHLAGRYDLTIIDIYQQPVLAKGAQIVAVPTLIKKLPPPLRRVIGDLSDPGRVLLALGVVPDTDNKTQNGMDRKSAIPKTR